MRVPLSWLKEYVDITLPVEELAERLTLAGLEVAAIERIGAEWDRDKIFVGEILEVKPHPNADRLVLAVVNYGRGAPMTVVTGAPNIRVGEKGHKVAFATVGARLIDGYSEEKRYMTLKPSKIRGVPSEGMVCSEKELGISDDHEGIILLEDDAPVGMPLVDYLGPTWRGACPSSAWPARWRRLPANGPAFPSLRPWPKARPLTARLRFSLRTPTCATATRPCWCAA